VSERADVAIVGAGMAGASLAAELAGKVKVLLLEAEEQPGYHATGRSAAFWAEGYGGPGVRPLTIASGVFLRELGLLGPRGALYIAEAEGEAALREIEAELPALFAPAGRERLEAMIPGLRPGWNKGLEEPGCTDIDVAGLHAYYLTTARRRGARLVTGARVAAVGRREGMWALSTPAGGFQARILVNAAGAWADPVARLAGVRPLGIQPYRRTIVQLRIEPAAPARLPLVIDALSRFYFKPEGDGRIWLSPHDESASEASDCAPEEIDVAVAIERLQRAVDWRVDRVERRWAGLRSFAPDRLPVYGFADDASDFFWFAGQGGFGIQTAPAAAKLGAALLLGVEPEPEVIGIDAALYRPGRFAN
jgi:D-arginine dehydrogenase